MGGTSNYWGQLMGTALFFLIAFVVFVTGLLMLGFTFHHWFVTAHKKRDAEAVNIDTQNANKKTLESLS